MWLCGSTLAPQFNLLYPNHKITCKKKVHSISCYLEGGRTLVIYTKTLGHATGLHCYDQVKKVKLLPLVSIPFFFWVLEPAKLYPCPYDAFSIAGSILSSFTLKSG